MTVAPVGTAAPGARSAERVVPFHVRLDNFDGPFDLLLQLISQHRMDVTEVALHRVTDEFIAHIRAMGVGLGPGAGHRVPGGRRHPARPEGRPAAARRRGRRHRGPGAARGQGPAVRPAAGLPGLPAGRGAVPGAGVVGAAALSRARSRSRTGISGCCPRCGSGSTPSGFAELAASVFRPRPPPTVGARPHPHLDGVGRRAHRGDAGDPGRARPADLRRAGRRVHQHHGGGGPVPRPAEPVPGGRCHVRPARAAGCAGRALDRRR